MHKDIHSEGKPASPPEVEPVTAVEVDQLRAGLLEGDPERRARVRAALLADQSLASANDLWDRMREHLDESGNDVTRLRNRLRLQRRRVLSGNTARKSRRFTLPQMALATATSVAVTMSLVLWLNQRPQQEVVSTTSAFDSQSTQLVDSSTLQLTQQVDFDLTSNVDFYVWMESQEDLIPEVRRKGT